MSRVENRLCWILAAEVHAAVLLLAFILCRREPAEEADRMPEALSAAAARPAPTAPAQVHWFDSLDEARAAALREGKLVFYYQLVGSATGGC